MSWIFLNSFSLFKAFGIDENLKKAALAVREKIKSVKTKPEVVRDWLKENSRLFAEEGVTTKDIEDMENEDLEQELCKVESKNMFTLAILSKYVPLTNLGLDITILKFQVWNINFVKGMFSFKKYHIYNPATFQK